MKLTGPACTETLNEAEKARRRERTPDNAGGVRVELRVRPTGFIVGCVESAGVSVLVAFVGHRLRNYHRSCSAYNGCNFGRHDNLRTRCSDRPRLE